ncbi:DUF6918 family protein [Nevskia soli]|uniref:DUF6918 family protein n=1 Tax=Nevskia soli TaxID=418856 RepID=UPI0004A741A2|nr:hypothetical protein [Nevskia soli]
MPALADIVLTVQNKDALVADCVQLTEGRIAARGGLRGIAMKTSLSLLKAARPDILPRAMQALLPDFVGALDPLYQDFVAAPAQQDFACFLLGRSDAAVCALLQVTDERAARAQNAAVKSVYARLRGGAESEVGAALPDFARLLSNYLPRTAR